MVVCNEGVKLRGCKKVVCEQRIGERWVRLTCGDGDKGPKRLGKVSQI